MGAWVLITGIWYKMALDAKIRRTIVECVLFFLFRGGAQNVE
jgi:hypothetical protein